MSKDEQFLHILTPHSLKSIDKCQRCLPIKFWKLHLSLKTGFNSHCNSQYCVCLYDRQFQICSLVMWMFLLQIYVLRFQNVPAVDSILHDLLIALFSHITKLQIWIWRPLKTHTHIGCCSGCKSSQKA